MLLKSHPSYHAPTEVCSINAPRNSPFRFHHWQHYIHAFSLATFFALACFRAAGLKALAIFLAPPRYNHEHA